MVRAKQEKKTLYLNHPYLSLASRIILGAIFIFAGISKVAHTDTLIWEIEQYAILPGSIAVIFGRILPSLEIILGVFLLSGLLLKVSTAISGLLVLSFAISKITAIASGLDIEVCPCFGPSVPLLQSQSLAIDIVMLLLTVQLLAQGKNLISADNLLFKKGRGTSRISKRRRR